MAISEIASASASGGGSTAVSITHGLTIASGDVLIAMFGIDGASGTYTLADNNGATPFSDGYAADTADSSHYRIWYRVAGASEPAAFAWTLGQITTWTCSVRQFRGVDATVFDVAPGAATNAAGQDTAPTAPSITITNAGAMGIALFHSDASDKTFASPTNSYGTELEVTAGRVHASYIRAGLSAGATGATACTLSGSDHWAANQFALKPAAAGNPHYYYAHQL